MPITRNISSGESAAQRVSIRFLPRWTGGASKLQPQIGLLCQIYFATVLSLPIRRATWRRPQGIIHCQFNALSLVELAAFVSTARRGRGRRLGNDRSYIRPLDTDADLINT